MAGVRDATVPAAAGQARAAEVIVEALRDISEAQAVERLQSDIWGSDAAWVVPSHLLYIVADYGGILLGARVDGELVGFVFGLLGRRSEKLVHASHMLGIMEGYRSHGLGYALKQRQRDLALEQGLDLMTWTFDPLEARNAYFNFHKLGATCASYRIDYYGSMRDAINQGLPSDRLLVEWDLHDGRAEHPESGAVPIVQESPTGIKLNMTGLSTGEPVSIQVPRDIRTLRQADPNAALRWRLAVRDGFMSALERGYVARDFRDGAHILYPGGDRHR